MNYARISEIVSPYNRVLALPWATGLWHFESLPELERLSQEISRQAAMIAYINAFGLYTLVSAMAIPLTLLLARARKETV
jgi:DHA2 family multidrug resistance protein